MLVYSNFAQISMETKLQSSLISNQGDVEKLRYLRVRDIKVEIKKEKCISYL
jgi:hypothetical protein